MSGLRRTLTVRARAEEGAAVIEALGMMMLLTSVLCLIMYVGVGFYNLTLMNTAAQSASISSQTQMDRWCSPGFTLNCAIGEQRARDVSRQIIDTVEPQLMFLQPGSFRAEGDRGGANDIVTIQRTGRGLPTPTPDNSGGMTGETLDEGWGYSFVRLTANFSLWNPSGDSPVSSIAGPTTIGTQAITPSYKDPNS